MKTLDSIKNELEYNKRLLIQDYVSEKTNLKVVKNIRRLIVYLDIIELEERVKKYKELYMEKLNGSK